MDTSKPELTFEESMKQVMKTLPPVIRDYLVQEKYTPVARSLMTKYGLRIDQGGVLEREIMLLLMGVENPTEFTSALAEEVKLSKQVIDGIVQDVNDQIFVPLRKEEEKGTVQPAKIAVSIPSSSNSQPVSHFKLENKIPLPHSVSQPQKNVPPPTILKSVLPPKVFLPRPSTLGEVVRSVLAAPKPLDSNNLLEDHEEPHIELNKAEVQMNLPGVLPPQVIPKEMPEILKIEPPIQFKPELAPEVRPSPILKVEPQIQKSAPVAPIISYSSDPYREPIDEPPTE